MKHKNILLWIKIIPALLISGIITEWYHQGFDIVYEWNRFKIGFYKLIGR